MSDSLKKILVVDDEPDILTIIKYSLELRQGFSVKCVASGEEALKVAPEFLPDLILLDLLMPGMDGIATYKELRKLPSFAKTPIVFITASIQIPKIEEYLKEGNVSLIVKPFDPLTLGSQLQGYWDQRKS